MWCSDCPLQDCRWSSQIVSDHCKCWIFKNQITGLKGVKSSQDVFASF